MFGFCGFLAHARRAEYSSTELMQLSSAYRSINKPCIFGSDSLILYDMPCDFPEGLLRSSLPLSPYTGKYSGYTPQALAFSRDRRGRAVPFRSESFLAASALGPLQLAGVKTPNAAPCGSRSTAARPKPGTSVGGSSTLPPSSCACWTAFSTSATPK